MWKCSPHRSSILRNLKSVFDEVKALLVNKIAYYLDLPSF